MPINSRSRLTERQHLEQVSKTTKVRHHKLLPLPLPDAVAHVWFWYAEVKTEKGLTHQEILAWSQLTGTQPTPFEVFLLRLLDSTFWTVYNDRNRATDS